MTIWLFIRLRKPWMCESFLRSWSSFWIDLKQACKEINEPQVENLQMILQGRLFRDDKFHLISFLQWKFSNIINFLWMKQNIMAQHFQRESETNLIYIKQIIFFSEVFVRLLSFKEHLQVDGTEQSDHACKDHYNCIVWKQYLGKNIADK